jgi:hypothetical protein
MTDPSVVRGEVIPKDSLLDRADLRAPAARVATAARMQPAICSLVARLSGMSRVMPRSSPTSRSASR